MPHLTFFCELEAHALEALFHDPRLIEELQALHAGVSLGLIDLSPERAAVVRRLNEAGIAVTAWLLLPREDGYWFNLDNAAAACARYLAFRSWTAEHELQWDAAGVDVEPDLRDVERLAARPLAVAWERLQRAFDSERLRQGQAQYRDLVARMRADGYRVESYVLPTIVDERRAGSTLWQRTIGLPDLAVDREVLMLYTSLLPGSEGVLWSYAADAQAIGVGSTGGGIDTLPKLDWEALRRDLLLAHCWTEYLYVFSLEGCVQAGFLPRLRELDWSAPVEAPFARAGRVNGLRAAIRGALWLSAHPAALLALVGAVAAWLVRPRPASKG